MIKQSLGDRSRIGPVGALVPRAANTELDDRLLSGIEFDIRGDVITKRLRFGQPVGPAEGLDGERPDLRPPAVVVTEELQRPKTQVGGGVGVGTQQLDGGSEKAVDGGGITPPGT